MNLDLYPKVSLFGILKDKQAYLSIVYVIYLFVYGIISFVYTITLLPVSLALVIIIVGIPLLLFFLKSVSYLIQIQTYLTGLILGVTITPQKRKIHQGGIFDQLKGYVTDFSILKSLIYSLIIFPFSVTSFTVIITGLFTSIGLMITIIYPLSVIILGKVDADIFITPIYTYLIEIVPEIFIIGLFTGLGIILLALTLHLSKLLSYVNLTVINDLL